MPTLIDLLGARLFEVEADDLQAGLHGRQLAGITLAGLQLGHHLVAGGAVRQTEGLGDGGRLRLVGGEVGLLLAESGEDGRLGSVGGKAQRLPQLRDVHGGMAPVVEGGELKVGIDPAASGGRLIQVADTGG